jgi:hypothetical protein
MKYLVNALSKASKYFYITLVIIALLPLTQKPTLAESTKATILFILDGSGSMWAKIDNKEKITIAKGVLIQLIEELPEAVHIGLEVYGHRREGDCNDIEMLVPVDEGNKDLLREKIQSINPRGKTPITESIRLAAKHIEGRKEETMIVLVSDGNETCGGDPCTLVKELKGKEIKFVMHVVGLDVTTQEKEQLVCIAEAGGGKYFTAQNTKQLKIAFSEVKVRLTRKAASSSTVSPYLGEVWYEAESGWEGVWKRQGSSNKFDAQWTGHGLVTAELTIIIEGNSVFIDRQNSSDGNDCAYTGTIDFDTMTVKGSYRCTRHPDPVPWEARIEGVE